MINASHFPLPELNGSFKASSTFDLVSHWILPRYTMVNNSHLQSSHAWSFMSENDVVRKLEKLGLILNHPEPALICSRCKYALQSRGVRVSRHLAEKHNVPASDRTELVTYIDSLRLPNPNLLNGRNDGSEPRPYLLISRGAACNHCSFTPKTSSLSNGTPSAITQTKIAIRNSSRTASAALLVHKRTDSVSLLSSLI